MVRLPVRHVRYLSVGKVLFFLLLRVPDQGVDTEVALLVSEVAAKKLQTSG